MSSSLMLQNKRAVVFGAGGSIGAAVAKEFAAEGAEVFLAGRSSPASTPSPRRSPPQAGGHMPLGIDALDGAAVDRYIDDVVQQTGGLDIEFNATGRA